MNARALPDPDGFTLGEPAPAATCERAREQPIGDREGPRKRRMLRWCALAVVGAASASSIAILGLRWIAPPTTAFMLLRGGDAPRHYEWTDYEAISPEIGIAVVAAEDQKFPFHDGFDIESIQRALQENKDRALPRGASTISQQVAKNLFLWPGRSMVRKGIEAYFTVLIETLWPKRRILEMYLNVAELGPGIFGVQAASERYFGKPASRVGPYEAALLAAVLPNPVLMHADRPSDYVRRRAREIQGQVRRLGGPAYLAEL